MNERRILIVEDDRDLLALLEDTIEAYCADCQVTLVSDGLAALEKLRQQHFDIILTDYGLPRMNGLDLAQAVRQASPYTPIVLMTGRLDDAELRARACALGLAGYVQKPFTTSQIWQVLQSSLSRS